MKRRSLSGSIGMGIFVIAFILVMLAFFSTSWLVSDYRITGAKFNRLGLWTHCFRNLPDPNDEYQRRFFAGCRWIFDPFTKGYDQIRGYLVPWFLVLTEIFYTLTFLSTWVCAVGVLIFYQCWSPRDNNFPKLPYIIGVTLIASGICAAFATVIFGFFGNRNNWMPGHDNNFFGWSFGVAIASAPALVVSGILFLTENRIQQKKRRYLKESEARFEMAQATKA